MIDRVRLGDLAARVGPVPLAAALAGIGVSELRDVLAIHRVEGRDDAGLERPVEIDFSLPDNGLRWEDVRRLAPVKDLLDGSPAIAELEASFRLAHATGVGLGVGRRP